MVFLLSLEILDSSWPVHSVISRNHSDRRVENGVTHWTTRGYMFVIPLSSVLQTYSISCPTYSFNQVLHLLTNLIPSLLLLTCSTCWWKGKYSKDKVKYRDPLRFNHNKKVNTFESAKVICHVSFKKTCAMSNLVRAT